MRKIVDGVQQFQQGDFKARQQLYQQLAGGQQPLALFITCSDSRIVPNLLTQTEPGELFIIRNAGNIVPPYSAGHGGEAGTIEYAVKALKIDDVIVCGHSHCGAMTGLLNPDHLTELPAVGGWLKNAAATARVMEEKFADVTDDAERLKRAIEQNVLVQLENLKTHPSVADALDRGELKLHGWTYEFETGSILAHDPGRGEFLPLETIDI